MYIDIHRHSSNKGQADIVLRNLFPEEKEEKEEKGFYSIGLHPWHIKNSDTKFKLGLVSEAAKNTSVIAIGETGIDKAIDTDIDTQKQIFSAQIEIAKITKKPIIIHCVRAYNELLKIRNESKHEKPWIIHWFNASPEMGKDLIRKGCYLSFGTTLFKENSKAFRTFIQTPVEHMFFETDDAQISIIDVYKKAAKHKQISIEKLQEQIIKNFYKCFGIKLWMNKTGNAGQSC